MSKYSKENCPRCTITGVAKQHSLTKIKDAFESTFQRDYISCQTERQPPMTEPPPANVIPKHHCYSSSQESTSKDTFKKPQLEKSNRVEGDPNSCFQSHFKMEIDHGRGTGSSTQRDSYKPVGEDSAMLRAQFQPRTHLAETTGHHGNLLGTLDNRKDMSSEYHGIFCNATQQPFPPKLHRYSSTSRRARGNMTARHTMTGGLLEDHVSRESPLPLSSQQRDYQYRSLPLLPRANEDLNHLKTSSIPLQGDFGKFPIPPTNNQLSYEAPMPSSAPSYQRAQAFARTHQSNFHPGDVRINPFNQVVVSSKGIPLNCFPPAGHPPVISSDMNVSHFPQGDMDTGRVTARMNFSSMQHSHRAPPPGFYPSHIQGAHTRVESHFQIGCPSNHLPPQSLVMSTYQPPYDQQHYIRPPPKDSIQFPYQNPDQYLSTTAFVHHPLPRVPREKLNPAALNKLKQSHWQCPQSGSACVNQGVYRTIHQSSFQHHKSPREVDFY